MEPSKLTKSRVSRTRLEVVSKVSVRRFALVLPDHHPTKYVRITHKSGSAFPHDDAAALFLSCVDPEINNDVSLGLVVLQGGSQSVGERDEAEQIPLGGCRCLFHG